MKKKRKVSAATKRRLKALRKKYGLGEFKRARLSATRKRAGPYINTGKRKKSKVRAVGFKLGSGLGP